MPATNLTIIKSNMALENAPYEEIKAKIIEELGEHIRDYAKLDYSKQNYPTINEFFLDNFADLK